MDVVPDMDDLLNELEASETTGKLKYGMNDPVMTPKIVLTGSSNHFSESKRNSTSILFNDRIEESENVVAVDIEARNVLADIINSVLLMEDDSLCCSIEANPEHVTEQAIEIKKCLTDGKSVSENIDDCKENKIRDNLPNHPSSYSGIFLNRNNEASFGEFFSKITDEMDRKAEDYAEMEHYLNSCGTNDAFVDISEQPYVISDTEVSSKFSPVEAFNEPASELGKETDKGIREAVLEKVAKDVTAEFDAAPEVDAALCTSIGEQSLDGTHGTIAAEEGSSLHDVQKNIFIGINCNETSVEHPTSSSTQLSITTNDAKKIVNEVKNSEDENEGVRHESDNEREQQLDLVEDSDHSMSECEIPVLVIDEMQTVSVVSSTHDISCDPEMKYLTESERQLGKTKPVWIDDKETLSCMLCCIKFTVFVRRHHCRCCGRVLCARCTSQKASLAYVNNPKKEQRVCDPCFETLKRIEELEKNIKTSEVAERNECVHPSDSVTPTKSVLKSRGKLENAISVNGDQESSNDTARGTSSSKRSVTFRDGLPPGYSSNDNQSSAAEIGSLRSKKHDSRKQHISRRLIQLHVADECICLLPSNNLFCSAEETSDVGDRFRTAKKDSFYLRSNDGVIVECNNVQELITLLKNFEPLEVMIFRNLWCSIKLCKYEDRTVMCIVSKGMSFVGLDEIFLAYYSDTQSTEFPIDYLWRIYEIYQNALSPRNESSDEVLGIRLAHNRVPALNQTIRFSNFNKPVARDILLFRPSVQTFENLLVPSSPFLVATFIYQSESIWANVIPQRLLFRLGLQASFYPTPIINDFDREPVYNSIFDTSVLKMFNDFRDWRFQMPLISGSTLTIQDNSKAGLIIPTWALDEIIKLINANKNMIAWGLDFSPDADSYLVCKQDDSGCFNSQIFTNGIENRKVTGASFIIIDGALKDGTEPFDVSVLEDGVTIRFRSDIMESLIESLLVGQDFEQISSAMKFSINWNDDSYAKQFVGGLTSPIDNHSLIGCYQYGLKKSRILASLYPIPNQLYWSIRLVSVYNVSSGRFVQRLQSKVFSVSEQITAQIATTLAPFVASLIEHNLRNIFFRIHVTNENAEYKVQPWPGMEKEFASWLDFLYCQVIPGLFTVCSYVTVGFHAELHMALISVRPNP